MRGKTAKLLRKAGVATKKDKRHFQSLDRRNKKIFLDFLRTALAGKGIQVEQQE